MGNQIDSDWYQFQENIKEHFEAIGASAYSNIKLEGVRGSHDIDVLVKPKFFGREITWIVEAKNWGANIPKEKVLAFLSIVQDVGADRGFLISNAGFQKGAYECAKNTNITLVKFEEFKESTKEFVSIEVIKHYKERVKLLNARYWSHPKRIRREYGLRHDLFELSAFSGTTLLTYIENVFESIERNCYPIDTDTGLEVNIGEKEISDFHQACNWLNLNLNLLDQQLFKAEMYMIKAGDFKPNIDRWQAALE